MHSICTGAVRRTSIARPSASGRAAAGKSAGSTEITWLGSRSATWSNQNDEIAVRTLPLSGIASGSTTSNTDTRSDATKSRRPSPTS